MIWQVLDPELSEEDVVSTFHSVGATDSLNEEQFGRWCEMLFSDLDNQQFVDQLTELMQARDVAKAAPKQI